MTYAPHWAIDLIGAPYKKDAVGPQEFDCLGFVEYVFRVYKNIDLPVASIRLCSDDNETLIREAARRSGLRLVVDGTVEEDDVLLMENIEGPHIGIVIHTNSKFYLLHSVCAIGVCCFPLADLTRLGYKNMRSWRIV